MHFASPPESEDEQRRLTSTLHALDHASRLAETAGEEAVLGSVSNGPDELRAVQLCAEAMRSAALVADEVAAPITSSTVELRHQPRRLYPGWSTVRKSWANYSALTAARHSALARMEH